MEKAQRYAVSRPWVIWAVVVSVVLGVNAITTLGLIFGWWGNINT